MGSIWQRIISRAASSSAKYTVAKPSKLSQKSFSSFSSYANKPSSASPSFTNLKSPVKQLGCVQSLLPLYTAIATARLTSCLNDGSGSCRTLSQELGLSVPR